MHLSIFYIYYIPYTLFLLNVGGLIPDEGLNVIKGMSDINLRHLNKEDSGLFFCLEPL